MVGDFAGRQSVMQRGFITYVVSDNPSACGTPVRLGVPDLFGKDVLCRGQVAVRKRSNLF